MTSKIAAGAMAVTAGAAWGTRWLDHRLPEPAPTAVAGTVDQPNSAVPAEPKPKADRESAIDAAEALERVAGVQPADGTPAAAPAPTGASTPASGPLTYLGVVKEPGRTLALVSVGGRQRI